MIKKLIIIFLFSVALCFPSALLARIGVSINLGKIIMDDPLNSGAFYELPPLTISNKGDEASDYEIAVTYHEGVEQLRPSQEWFAFTPKSCKHLIAYLTALFETLTYILISFLLFSKAKFPTCLTATASTK